MPFGENGVRSYISAAALIATSMGTDMSAPLKNVAISDVEAAVAKALATLIGGDANISVNIGSLDFHQGGTSVDIRMTAYQTYSFSEGVTPI